MYKVVAFVHRLPQVSREEFKAYYEKRHVPLVQRLLPMLHHYERNYPDVSKVRPGEGLTLDQAVGFDAIAVMRFADKPAFDAWKAALKDPQTLGVIQADEANFLDNTRTRLFVMDERVSEAAASQGAAR
jgi:uncharacterized protein (TIGR02118 family)